MSTINPIFQVSKGLARTLQKQGVHADAANSVKEAFAEIQTDLFKFSDEARQAREFIQRAHADVEQAKLAATDVANRPADWHQNIKDRVQVREMAYATMKRYTEDELKMARKKAGLSQITLKQKGGVGRGKEYAQVKSHTLKDEKHPSLKVNLPARGDKDPAKYAQETADFAGDFVETMQHRSQWVSPHLATTGPDHVASLRRYKDVMTAFYKPKANGEVNAQTADYVLQKRQVQSKVLQNGNFRIKLQNRQDVGRLSYQLKQRSDQSIARHIDEGVDLAGRVSAVLDFTTDPAEQAIKDNISTRFIRDNFLSKKVDLTRLEQMEVAKQTLVNQQPRIRALAKDNVFIKILRDGSFRITRTVQKNGQQVVAQTKTLPFNQKNMAQYIRNSLTTAENFTQDVEDKLFTRAQKRYPLTKAEEMHEDGTLMNKVSASRKLRNKSHDMKKAFLNFLG